MKEKIRAYYDLTKPGIVLSNVMAALAGYFFASGLHPDLQILAGVVFGVGFIIAGSCVYNNYLDRKIDSAMTRTKKRALVTGFIKPVHALIFGSALLVIGFSFLLQLTDITTVWIGVAAVLFYVFIYGYFKRKTVYGALVGTIPGALPAVAGYIAVSNVVNPLAISLFCMWVAWQMAHFYAIAMFRRDEYAKANVPVYSIKYGLDKTRHQIVFYIILFVVLVLMPTIFGYTGIIYAIIMGLLSLGWVYQAVRAPAGGEEARWARGIFFYSLAVMIGLCVMLAIGADLP